MHNWSVNLKERVSFDEPDANGKVILKCGDITVIGRLCGLVVRVSGYRYRGPGFDPRRYQIF